MLCVTVVLLSCTAVFATFSTDTIKVVIDDDERETFTDICDMTGFKIEGITWSRCREEGMLSIGCVTNTGEKLNFGETYRTKHAEFRCDSSNGKAVLMPIACIANDKLIRVGQYGKVGKFYFQCAKRTDGIGLDVAGCSDTSGSMVAIGSVYDRGFFMYECKAAGRKIYEYGIGCIPPQYGVVDVGEIFQMEPYYYQCKRKGERGVKLEAIGCSNADGEMVESGERFHIGIVLYECQTYVTEQGKLSVQQEAVGCVMKSDKTKELKQHLFGERWYKPIKSNIGYVLECAVKDDVVVPTVVECVTSTPLGNYVTIPVGCGTRVDATHIFMCTEETEGGVMAKVKSVSSTSRDEDIIMEYGLPLCPGDLYYGPLE